MSMFNLPGLDTLVSAFGAGMGTALPEATVKAIYQAITSSQLRKVWRRSIRDFVADEVVNALIEHGIKQQDALKYVDKKEDYYKQESRNRFDPALQEMD